MSGVVAGVAPLNSLLIELVVDRNESRELRRCQGAKPKTLRDLDPVVIDDGAGLCECSEISIFW